MALLFENNILFVKRRERVGQKVDSDMKFSHKGHNIRKSIGDDSVKCI